MIIISAKATDMIISANLTCGIAVAYDIIIISTNKATNDTVKYSSYFMSFDQ
jgi:hypothetical protein